MFENIENLKIEEIHKGTSKHCSSTTNRRINSLIIRTAGCMRYTFPDKVMHSHPGEVIFLPSGSNYTNETVSDCPCEYVSFRFHADITNTVPFVYSLDGFSEVDELADNLPLLWKFGNRADHYKCYSVFYNLLAYLDALQRHTYADKSKTDIISPAISYLKMHIYDCNLKTEKLPELCGISGTYFRKIFQSNYAISPQKYILSKRLSHAKTILDSGEFESITEVASSVGYNDPLYFSRAFKKKYGLSPSQYLKE